MVLQIQSRYAACMISLMSMLFLSPTVVSDPAGPDLVGIRIGMTPEEALAVLKAREPDQQWETVSAQLQFTVQLQYHSEHKPVPNGTYRAVIQNKTEDSALNRWQVYMTPLPGEERVAGVSRSQNFGNQPALIDKTVATLVEKYGEPGVRSDRSGPVTLLWAFDAEGKPQPIKANGPYFYPCMNIATLVRVNREAPQWGIGYEPIGDDHDGNQLPYVNTCGATMVRAIVHPSLHGNGLAQTLTVELIGHAVATNGNSGVTKLLEAAAAADSAEALEKASKSEKPDL